MPVWWWCLTSCRTLQEAAAVWDDDWPTALRWAEASRGTVTARRLRAVRGTDGVDAVVPAAPIEQPQLSAGLPAGSAVLMLTALSQHTVDANNRKELPQPAAEPGVLAMLLTPDGATAGVADPERTAAFRTWAASSRRDPLRDVPLDVAVAHAVNVVSKTDHDTCYHDAAAQLDALRQLYDLIVGPIAEHLTAATQHLIVIPDQVTRAPVSCRVPISCVLHRFCQLRSGCSRVMAATEARCRLVSLRRR